MIDKGLQLSNRVHAHGKRLICCSRSPPRSSNRVGKALCTGGSSGPERRQIVQPRTVQARQRPERTQPPSGKCRTPWRRPRRWSLSMSRSDTVWRPGSRSDKTFLWDMAEAESSPQGTGFPQDCTQWRAGGVNTIAKEGHTPCRDQI
eukprot:3145204-Prymnesium_polylepis.1